MKKNIIEHYIRHNCSLGTARMGTSGYCFEDSLYHVGARAYDPRTAQDGCSATR
jgi:hypothetical protein